MMYANKMAVAIKTNGRVLRENKDTVYCPFGAEYSILLKNLNTVRAVVNVFIDGENIVPGGLVLNAGQEIDLERSIKNGNLSEGNKLKFIERTGAVEQHRGVKLEDGIVRIEYQFEIARPIINISDNIWKSTPITGAYDNYKTYNVNGMMRSVDYSAGETMKATAASATNATLQSMNISATSAHDGMATMDWNDAGITVPGSKSEQKFQTTYLNALDPQKYSIVLKILGETPENEAIRNPITVKSKPKCITCGKQNKATAKFCTQCGTSLTLFA